MSKILIVEDEEAIADLEKDYLELSGFDVEIEHDGSLGLERALNEEFDLYVLDLMLPGVDGFEICKKIREVKNTPILMVSAKKDDIDKIRGLGLGADDYVTKPFGVLELAARIRSLLRRSAEQQPVHGTGKIKMGGLAVDTAAREVVMNGETVSLTYKEYELLMYLIDNRTRVVERDELLNKLWDYSADIETRTLDIHIRTLRQKLGEEGSKYIKTIRSVGYRFVIPQENDNKEN